MYLPAYTRKDDPATLLALMRAHPFATLVTAPGGVPFASHVPLLVEEDAAGLVLRSHLARANEQWQHFALGEALAIFHGPHALVHANWYGSDSLDTNTVPTWNYAVVHAAGPARVLDGEAAREIAFGLVAQHTPDLRPLSADHERRLLAAIVTFELRVTRLEGKFKLSGNKPPQDRASVIRHLAASERDHERAVAELMRARE